MSQLPFVFLLAASALMGALTAGLTVSNTTPAPTAMYLTPERVTTPLSTEFTLTLRVSATVPVNVFAGVIHFDPTRLSITSIDYNTSIADLWAEKPWYATGAGTLNFAGGSTRPGGFIGDDTLLTITFASTGPGESSLSLTDIRILQHDGLGTDVSVATPIDTIITIQPTTTINHQIVQPTAPTIVVLPIGRRTDLNGDGVQTITDVSIFMRHLATQNRASDFNGDGLVSARDLSILLQQ